MNQQTSSAAPLTFREGFRAGIPICLGYLSVSFAYGMISVRSGVPLWAPTLISMTCLTGTGQFVGTELMSLGAALVEIICTLCIINARYFLMSLTLSQRLPADLTLWQRLIVAFGNTDEIFAVSMCQTKPLNFRYLGGMILSSYLGWVGGTVIGSFAGSLIPEALLSAMGIALYAMFSALVIPAARKEADVALAVCGSAVLSCILTYAPVTSGFGSGWIIILSGVSAAVVCAVLMPRDENGKRIPRGDRA